MVTAEDVAEAMFGPLVPGRDCGGCTACCAALTIDTKELRKPAGALCRYNDGFGCTIYEVRPDACRHWYCGWRRLEMLPDDFRPDRSGVMISFEIAFDAPNPLARCCIIVRITEPGLATQRALNVLLDMFRAAKIAIWLGEGRRRTLVHPTAEIGRHLIAGTDPGGELGEEIRQWQDRLPPG